MCILFRLSLGVGLSSWALPLYPYSWHQSPWFVRLSEIGSSAQEAASVVFVAPQQEGTTVRLGM